MANKRVKTTLSNHIITICLIVMGIPVAIKHGIDAEKNKIDEIDTIAPMKRSSKVAFANIKAGRNISAKELAMAWLNSSGWGI